MSTFHKDMTEGSVTKHLLKFALPFLASNLLQALYNMADMLIVGQYCGPVGTSAVGIGGQVTILVTNLISGLAIGGTVVIAQLLGARRQQEVSRAVGTVFSLYGIAAVIMTVVMLLLSRPLLVALQTPAESFDDAYAYLIICMAGTLFVFGYNAVSAILRGMGDSRHPLLFVAIAAVTNVVLDIVFVGPLNMGPAGAAWATIIAQALSFILSIVFLRRHNFVFDFHPRSFRIDKIMAKELLAIGLPSSIQGTLVTLSFMVLTGIGNTVAGIVGSTALGIAGKVNSIAVLPAIAMQMSVSSMAGQNIGAGKPKRALKTMFVAIGLAFSISAAVFIGVNLFAEPIVILFIGSNNGTLTANVVAQCITVSVSYLHAISVEYLLIAGVFCINGLAMAAGQTLFSMANGLITSLILRVPLAYLLAMVGGMGLNGVAYAIPIATMGGLIIGVVYLLTGRWKVSRVKGIPVVLE